MSEYYDHYHRWESLAEFHFLIDSDDEDFDDDNYLYCLCSRAFIRDGVKTYYAEKEDVSESDIEVMRGSQSLELDDHSHVHFSLDTCYKVKCEKDEGASCYCSASHTDNYCSTDEHDPAQIPGTMSHALQPSDSGADLTYQDCHSDYTTLDKLEKMDQDFLAPVNFIENYLSEDTWEKFWAINGERLIWASWIKNYSDYINPGYLDDNNDLLLDDNNVPKPRLVDQSKESTDGLNKFEQEEDSIRERKFSYDSKVNPYKKHQTNQLVIERNYKVECNKDNVFLPIGRRRSCSEHDRIVSPRTLAGTDSMTNVTKMTISSYDVTSSRVTSDSSPTDDYSMSSSNSEDQSNDQTRIANIDDNLDPVPLEELDTEQYWQLLWKKHFGEQYSLHYANYIEQNSAQNKELPAINIEIIPKLNVEEKSSEIECENSEGNSQEMPTVIEVQAKVNEIKLEEKVAQPKINEIKLEEKAQPKRKNKKTNNIIIGSVGMLLQNLLKEEQKKKETEEKNELDEVTEAGDVHDNKNGEAISIDTTDGSTVCHLQQSVTTNNYTSYSYDDGDDDPPEDIPVILKRSHEIDDEVIMSEKIKSTFEIMGFCIRPEKIPKGQLVYRNRITRLRPPRNKRAGVPKKTYFDEDGNPYQLDQKQYVQDEKEMQTDDDCQKVKSDSEKCRSQVVLEPSIYDVQNKDENAESSNVTEEAADVPLPPDVELINDVQDNTEEKKEREDVTVENIVAQQFESSKRSRRRPKRYSRADDEECDLADLPPELKDDPKMFKYWKKRHSLFHRFDEGIRLDRESWFSVTPESVAQHIAAKCTYDIVLDAFCGAGGNTIQFARTSKKVIAVDIDAAKIEMARHNAAVYGVVDRIEFIEGDFFEVASRLKADMVFLSPPWGGPNYSNNEQYDIESMLEPRPASELMEVARSISPNIALYVPRNTMTDQILSLAKEVGGSVEIEQSYLDKRFVAITAYFY